MKRRISLVCLGVMCLFGVAACSGDDGDNGGTTDTGTMGDVETDAKDYTGACDLFTNAGCESGQNCYPAGGGEKQCVEYTAGNGVGSGCSGTGGCGEGLYCYTEENVCRERCNPDGEPNCPSGGSCIGFSNVDGFGFCQPPCSLYPEDDCGSDQRCYPFTNGNQCVQANSGKSVGDSCEPGSEHCASDQFCISRDEGSTYECRPACDPGQADACPEGQSCVGIGSTGANACVSSQGG